MASSTAHPNHQLISSEDVQGTEVYGLGEEKVGEIDHLMIDKLSGRVIYAVMSFGGFLGLGHSHYPLPWAALKYDTGLGGYRTAITEQQLKDAPEFSDDFVVRPRLGNQHPSPLWGEAVLGCHGCKIIRSAALNSTSRRAPIYWICRPHMLFVMRIRLQLKV